MTQNKNSNYGIRQVDRVLMRAWVVFIIITGASALPGWVEAAQRRVSLGTLAPERTSYHHSLLEMREKWRKAPGGGVRLRIYAGGKMGGEAKMVSQMRLGALDAALLTNAGLSEIEPAVTGLQSIPMMFRSLEEVDYIGQKLKPILEQRMENAGFKVLFWTDAGWMRFFSKGPVRTPDDLKKTKLFALGDSPPFIELLKSAGFDPVPLETTDIVPMLDTGLITSVPMPPFVALASQVYSRAPHMLELNWAPLTGALVIRKKVWEKIAPEARAALLEAATEAGKQNKEKGRSESDKAVAVMKQRGLKVQTVSPELDAEWRRTAERVYPKIRGIVVPEEIFDRVVQLLRERRAAEGGAKP